MEKSFHFGRRAGVPRQVGGAQLTPESLVLLVRLGSWGYVWNWPVAVTVAQPPAPGSADAGPRVERHAIVDVTRLLLWGMWAVTLGMLLAAVFGPLVRRAGKRKPL